MTRCEPQNENERELMENDEPTMARSESKPAAGTPKDVTVTVTHRPRHSPTVDKPDAEILKGGNLAFFCQLASLIIVCQHNNKGTHPEHHCPFPANVGTVFKVPANTLFPVKVKSNDAIFNEPYKYTIVVVPADSSDVQFLDPTIIIRQTA